MNHDPKNHFALANLLPAALAVALSLALAACGASHAETTAPAASPIAEVATAQAKAAATTTELRLPARALAGEAAKLYPRATGFIAERLVDLGDRVTAGQVLARIEAPEIIEAVHEAEAVLAQVRADLELAKLNYERASALVESGAVSREMFNERKAQFNVAQATQSAAAARLSSAKEKQAYLTVRAPFDGVVVNRSIERGDRVVGDSASTIIPLYEIASLNPLRIVADVPQSAVLQVQSGLAASVTFPELPGEELTAQVVRTAHNISEAQGGMRIELNLPNPDERLPAGLVGEVRIAVPRGVQALLLPLAAVMQGADGVRVARIDADGVVQFQNITLGRNFGVEVEVLGGLSEGDTVVLAPNALLTPGSHVKARAGS